jgi:hypothetical protein
MMSEKEAIKIVIETLERNEPKCSPCNGCMWYYNDKQRCEEEQLKYKKLHDKWEDVHNYWLMRLKNAK